MTSDTNIGVLIMAAGESKRMQGIKQLLPWKNSNLLLETIKNAKNTTMGSVLVVLGANAEHIADECNFKTSDVDYLINPTWHLGLGNSIAFGIKHLCKKEELPQGILICLADQPLITNDYLNVLAETFKQNPKNIIATNYTRKTGVPALFPTKFYTALSQLKGDYGAKELLKTYADETIGINAGNKILDIDTKQDYEQLTIDTDH